MGIVKFKFEGKTYKGRPLRSYKREMSAWYAMIYRCYNPRDVSYIKYKAAGITVCRAWRDSFLEFLKHIGPCPDPKLTLDRKNGKKGYCPGNIRWASRLEQSRNTKANWKLSGTESLQQLASKLGIPAGTLYSRIARGWSLKEAITIPRLPVGTNRSTTKRLR